MKQLHFTFGPVQDFISEARKTADLRCGSYLISCLAAHAIKGALDAGAEENRFFPAISGNPLLEAVRYSEKRPDHPGHPASSIGSLPNRFSVPVASDETGKKLAAGAEESLRSFWGNVCEASWTYLAGRHASLVDGRGIWDRQTSNLWEINWVLSDNPRDLARRKMMRTFPSAEEPGRKCTICGGREELGDGRFYRSLATAFESGFLDPAKERLCAVCLIKRTLPKVGAKAFGWKALSGSFYSTPDIASDPWRRDIIENSRHQDARQDFSRTAGVAFDNAPGTYFFPGYQEDLTGADTVAIGAALSRIVKSVGSSPRPTYAMLTMDGDNMGVRLSGLDDSGRKELSQKILNFSLEVRQIVEGDSQSRSRLVYAGGEDVFALVPMDLAISAAWKVRNLYRETFTEFDEKYRSELEGNSTISAGLLFCPMTLPLRAATREAHRLLDEDSKGKTGRDALTVGVWKSGGQTLKVSRKWDHRNWVETLMEMASTRESQYPSRFLYQAREIIGSSENLPADTIEKLLALEYHGSREKRFESRDLSDAEKRIAPLIAMSREGDRRDPSFFRLVRFFHEEASR